ncbi:hypothetical protein OG241_05835 [Streptomyces sp. NBC_01390]|uniref:hypothetical protein n=1 Tax=Streptomyces sp. NBC_01390 TaxID=2903850 RepID=UPI00324E7D3D
MGTSSGAFDHDGWWISQPGDDPRSTQFASAHESHHKQLQDSTSYGAVARVYHELGKATGQARYGESAELLTRASTNVQEAFASWLPAAALAWTRADLVRGYPEYGPHYDALESLVGGIKSPYLRFHAAHTLCRACMQTTAIATALRAGLHSFSLADIRDRDLPDSRFAFLRRRPPNWEQAVALLTAEAERDERLHGLITAASLSAALFDPALEDVWQRVNQVMYDTIADALRTAGLLTLTLDEHLELTPALLAAAHRIGGRLDLRPGHRRRQSEVASVVLGNAESEAFTVAPPLLARLLPRGTDPGLMVADLTDPHLFLTHRRTAALAANYTMTPDSSPWAAGITTVARRTVVEPTGHVVELLELPGPETLTDPALPVFAVAPLSLFAEPHLAPWLQGSWPRTTALLLDVPLAPHLDLWLSRPDARFHHVFLRIESFGRVVPFLVGTVKTPDESLPALLIRPLSHAGVRVHKAAFAEMYVDSPALVEDADFLAERQELLNLSLAHLAGEEIRFGPSTTRMHDQP